MYAEQALAKRAQGVLSARSASWRVLVDTYILGRRETAVADDKDHTPILAVELHQPCPYRSMHTFRSLSGISWYERTPSKENGSQRGVSEASPPSETGPPVQGTHGDQEPSRKRLKLRDRKHQDLTGAFDSLQSGASVASASGP